MQRELQEIADYICSKESCKSPQIQVKRIQRGHSNKHTKIKGKAVVIKDYYIKSKGLQ